jgi:His/Glu/Gln/Arg/opine family amino acid ABC transporter permease subunit
MSSAAEARNQLEMRETPEDRRLASLANLVLGLGIASIGLALGGTLVIQVAWAISGGPVSQECVRLGLEPQTAGAPGVCNMTEALLSGPQALVLGVAAVLGAAAIALGFGRYRRMPTKGARERALSGAVLGIQGLALAGILFAFRALGDPDRFFFHFLNFGVLDGSFGAFLNGAKNTVILAAVGEFGGIVLGLALALLLLSNRKVVRAPARVYINFFRGTPLIWQLSVFYFGFALGLGFPLSTYQAALIVFILNTGAYAAEVFRAGIQSIERGQLEAARSLGMSYPQAMRYAVIPQAFRRVIPPLLNEFVILIKDTSLVIVLGLAAQNYELFTTAREGYSDTFNASFFTAAAAGYLAITLPLIGAVNAVERRLRSGLVTVTT